MSEGGRTTKQSLVWGVIVLSLLGAAVARDCDETGGREERRAVDENEDPFADPFSPDFKKEEPPETFRTTGGFTVEPWTKSWLIVKKDDWPKINTPETFSSSFYEPRTVWRNEGGYFASFNAGEFGAGLFYADRRAERWTRVMRAHVESLYNFTDDICLAIGGLTHMGLDRGEVHLVMREPHGGWAFRLVFRSAAGKAKMIGLSHTGMSVGDIVSARLAVFALCSEWREVEELFGVSAEGVVYALGARVIDENGE